MHHRMFHKIVHIKSLCFKGLKHSESYTKEWLSMLYDGHLMYEVYSRFPPLRPGLYTKFLKKISFSLVTILILQKSPYNMYCPYVTKV